MEEVELPNPEELEEKKKDSFGKRVALVTAIFAVALAITSLGGNNATKEMLLSQQQASDQWAFYQSKSLKQQIYHTQRMQLEAGFFERRAGMRQDVADNYEKTIKKMSEEETRYDTDKKDIEKESKKLEAERDLNMVRDHYFDYAEVLLQIAIVMSSISILAGSRPVFVVSLFSAAAGVVLSLNGYLLLFRLPFIH